MERVEIQPGEAVPTILGRLDSGRLLAVESWFNDPELRALHPVELLSLGGEWLTMEGHHRLAVALQRETPYPAIIYSKDDGTITLNGQETRVDGSFYERMRLARRLAIVAGHRTFDDLLRNSFRLSDFPYLQRVIEDFKNNREQNLD